MPKRKTCPKCGHDTRTLIHILACEAVGVTAVVVGPAPAPAPRHVSEEEALALTRESLLTTYASWAEGCEVCKDSTHSRNAFMFGVAAAVRALSDTEPRVRGEAARLLFAVTEQWAVERELLAQDAPVV